MSSSHYAGRTATAIRTSARQHRPGENDPENSSMERREHDPRRLEHSTEDSVHGFQRHSLVRLHQSYGNQTVQRLVRERFRPTVQPVLQVGAPNDAYEREAEQAAERVTRMPESVPLIRQRTSGAYVQRHGEHDGLTAAQKYAHTLEHAGTTPAAWEANLVSDATFLGVSITRGIHQELADRLVLAENFLRARHPDQSDAEVAGQIGLYSISGRRVPGTAVGGARISNHAFGLAIDVNYRGNPFIARSATVDDIIARATEFVLGDEIRIRRRQPDTTEEIRARYERASDALRSYFAMRENRQALTAHLTARGLPTDTETVDRWMRQITADYQNTTLQGEFATPRGSPDRDPAAGFIDLSQELVEALTGRAGLTWGGAYARGKDIMHFGWRQGTVRTGHRV